MKTNERISVKNKIKNSVQHCYYYTDRFYPALFSALEQTHCVHVACVSEYHLYSAAFVLCVFVLFVRSFVSFRFIHRSDVVTAHFGLLHGSCHVKLLPSRLRLVTHVESHASAVGLLENGE